MYIYIFFFKFYMDTNKGPFGVFSNFSYDNMAVNMNVKNR